MYCRGVSFAYHFDECVYEEGPEETIFWADDVYLAT